MSFDAESKVRHTDLPSVILLEVALWTFLDALAVFFDGRLLAFFFGFCDFVVWLFLFSCSSSKARFTGVSVRISVVLR